ncbi:L30e-like protein [Diplocarpon rosae]|nr:L30e-like protein [Diplocarpon rosae]
MRLIKQNIERDGSGTVTLFPEEPEDMTPELKILQQWHAYNLIAPTDLLRASAIRRVTNESSTGSTSSVRVHITLLIRVTSIDFDPQAGQLHVSGQVAEENKHVKVGAFHTLDLELQRNFTLEKSDGWDSVALDVVREAVKQDKEGVVPAVVMQEGMANICLITEHQTVLKQRVETGIPRKRSGRAADHDKGLVKFYENTLETLKRHVDITQPRPLLLASPGFTAAGFLQYILEEATRKAEKAFMAMLRKDDGRAWYGPREVEHAVAKGAVGRGGGVLLINNSLFRSQEVGTRKRWVTLVDKVKGDGGDARILSSDHESGKRLDGLGGIAAILTFPVEDWDDGSDEDEG